MTVALLLILSAAPACRLPEHPKRAAMDAVTSFVLRSVFDLQGRAPLTQNSVRPVRQATEHRMLLVATYSDGRLVITRCRTL